MSDRPQKPGSHRDAFEPAREHRERRKLQARENGKQSVWFGLGMFGLVGWSVAVPAVLGTLAGIWIDRRTDSRASWTLSLLLIGVAVGCANAWRWVKQEGRIDED